MSVDQLNVQLNLDAEEFSDGMKSAISLIKKLDSAIEVTDESIKKNRSIIRSWARAVRGSLTEFYSLTQLLSPITNTVSSITSSFIRANAEWEKTIAIMSGLASGAESVESATKMLNSEIAYLEELALKTPFTIQNLQASMVKLKAGGIDNLRFGMSALVDSVAKFGGTSTELDRAAIAIQQMSGKGVVSMEELRQQLGEAVPNAMQLMARGLNVSMGELSGIIESGTLEAKSAIRAMFYQMEIENGGAAQRMMGTWDGIMSQITTRLNKIMREMGATGLFEELKTQLQDFLDLLNRPETMTFFTEMARSMTELIRKIVSLAKYIDDLNVTMDILRNLVVTFAIVKFTKSIGAASRVFYGFVHGVDDSIRAVKGLAAPLSVMRVELEKQKRVTQASMEMFGFYNANLIKTADAAKRKAIIISGLTSTLRGLGVAAATIGRRMLSLLGPIGAVASIVLELANAFNLFGNEIDNVREKAQEMSTTLNADEYKTLSKSVSDAKNRLAEMTKELEKQNSLADTSTRAGILATNRANLIKAQMADLKKQISEDMTTLAKQSEKIGKSAADSFTPEFNNAMKDKSIEIKLDYTKSMNALAEARKNVEGINENELNKQLDEQKKTSDKLYFERTKAAQDAAAKEIYITKKAEIEKAAIGGETQEKQLDALKQQLELRLALNQKFYNDNISMMEKVGQAGVVQLDKASSFWDGSYRKMFLEQASLVAKLNGENAAYAKFQAKSLLEKQKDTVFTRSQTEALASNIDHIKEQIRAKKQLDATDIRLARSSAALASNQEKVEQTNPWLKVTSQQKKYLRDISLSIDTTKEMAKSFGEFSEEAKRSTQHTQKLKELLADQEGLDFLTSLQKMKEMTSTLEEQSMTESEIRSFRRDSYNEQIGYIQQLKNNIDELAMKSGMTKQELLQMFDGYEKALGKSIDQRSATSVEKLFKTWGDVTTQMDNMWSNTFRSMSGSLADFVMTGKLNFESLANSIIKNLIQISIQAAASEMFGGSGGIFGSLFGSSAAGSGAASTTAGATVTAFAKGGIAKANHPQVAIFGEGSMNEAFVPLPDGRAIPVNMNGSSAPKVSVNVINQTGEEATAEKGDMKFDGEQWVLDVVMKAMGRPGQFRSAMKGTNRQ